MREITFAHYKNLYHNDFEIWGFIVHVHKAQLDLQFNSIRKKGNLTSLLQLNISC